jgi:hypothetical protein
MPLTFTPVKGSEWEAGRLRGRTYDVQFDNSYLTTGELLNPDDVGLLTVLGCQCLGVRGSGGGSTTAYAVPVFNLANGNLQAFETGLAVDTLLSEVTTAQDLSGNIYRIMFYGMG